jgi:hypothetical protein
MRQRPLGRFTPASTAATQPFRRVKHTLAAHPAQREAWFDFEHHVMEMIARRWCESHGISPRWITRPRKPSD